VRQEVRVLERGDDPVPKKSKEELKKSKKDKREKREI
jgi:hypothetical protein